MDFSGKNCMLEIYSAGLTAKNKFSLILKVDWSELGTCSSEWQYALQTTRLLWSPFDITYFTCVCSEAAKRRYSDLSLKFCFHNSCHSKRSSYRKPNIPQPRRWKYYIYIRSPNNDCHDTMRAAKWAKCWRHRFRIDHKEEPLIAHAHVAMTVLSQGNRLVCRI